MSNLFLGASRLATPNTADALSDTADERMAQVAKARTDERAADGTVEWLDILMEEVCEAAAEDDHVTLRAELVQVAAVALSWVEDIDRKARQ